MQARFRKGWADTQVADDLRSGRNTDIAGRIHPQEEDNVQDLVKHATTLCSTEAPPGRTAPRGNLARELSKALVCVVNFSFVRVPNAPVKTQVPDPLTEETMIRESTIGYQTDTIAKAESRLHPRYTQMKDARPFEGEVSDRSSGELGKQQRSSILSWNAGPKRGEAANSMVGSFHVIMVQDTLSRHQNKRGATVPHLPQCRLAHPLS